MSHTPHTEAALSSAAPLKQSLAEQSAQARRELNQYGFARQDYQRLAAIADAAIEHLRRAGIEAGSTGRLARARRVLGDLLAILENPDAEVVPPSESEVYLTGLELGQLSQIVHTLVQPNGRWNEPVTRVVSGEAAPDVNAEARFKLQFATMCRQAHLKIEPPNQGIASDMVLDLNGWRIGVAGTALAAGGDVSAAVAQAVARLKADRLAGLIVLEVTPLVWPERQVIRVASDAVAVHELQRRADWFLASQKDAVWPAVDPAYAFGILAVATLPTYNVATRHVAFSTTFRIAALCDDHDPRAARLSEFAQRFQRLGR
ncbi:MAG: hypothetical protein KF866_04785 [Phycisphaeraceae bacterium]|nr:hypothetical protein [Phycisphaeraceae bacterium]